MGLLNRFKRQLPEPPTEVIKAACDLYGISPEHVSSIQTEQLNALSDSLWVIKLNEHSSAVIAYAPEETGQPVAVPWFD